MKSIKSLIIYFSISNIIWRAQVQNKLVMFTLDYAYLTRLSAWFMLMIHFSSVQKKDILKNIFKIYHIMSYNLKLKTLLSDFLSFVSTRIIRPDQSNSLRLYLQSESLRPNIQEIYRPSLIKKPPNLWSSTRVVIPQMAPTTIPVLLGYFNIYKGIPALISFIP